ncbi:DNA adenine methylase [Corynebacterium macclintockiae]|uniref:DNA adenine methylase n=1 Tax=Corynebacterium macclintockiae TaxID=2913501 RepID=UPI00254D7A29|nr:DNA adenine methylase [Corynebacterium macclintockiae]MDK8869331.1 DNA adenine methylase [Corynebacterium macclintockiae]
MRYIGSKINLIPNIEKLIKREVRSTESTFLDIFAGTNSVARHFKPKYQIITNDTLAFSYLNALSTIKQNGRPAFIRLSKQQSQDPIKYLNEEANKHLAKESVGYYESVYSPTGNAQYFTRENAKRIDYIREKIATWSIDGKISRLEEAYLISSLIEAVPLVSNTTGTYGAFLKSWDKRAFKPLKLEHIEILNNGKNNRCFMEDANTLAAHVEADIVYIDPPYNGRQYAANYHVLENIAEHRKPEVKGKTSISDWSAKKSNYCSKQLAFDALTDLIDNLKAKHFILSYNSEGIIPRDKLETIFRDRPAFTNVQIETIPYRKYRSKIVSKKSELYEILIYANKKDTYTHY